MPVNLDDVRRTLARTPEAVRSLVAAVPDAALAYREAPDAWNIFEILCHLADGEITDWMPRVKIILSAQTEKRFTPFDRRGGFTRYRGQSPAAVLDEFTRLRGASVAELGALGIGPAQLSLEGEHPEFGRVTLEQLLATWATHDFAHLAQISRVTTRYLGRDAGPWRAYFSLLRDQVTVA